MTLRLRPVRFVTGTTDRSHEKHRYVSMSDDPFRDTAEEEMREPASAVRTGHDEVCRPFIRRIEDSLAVFLSLDLEHQRFDRDAGLLGQRDGFVDHLAGLSEPCLPKAVEVDVLACQGARGDHRDRMHCAHCGVMNARQL